MERSYLAALACLPEMNILYLPRLLSLAGGARRLWGILELGGVRAAALVGSERAASWALECRGTDPVGSLESLAESGTSVVIPGDEAYPDRLGAIYDPPPLLFVRGSMPHRDGPHVAIVGSRKATGYGRQAAEAIAAELAARGVVVVSGAAYGADGRAHVGCLEAGGHTIAVLGCGIDRAYPSGHAHLLRRIVDRGAVISEYPPGTPPRPWRFPHRNRIIAGISHAVVVVEAASRSGALITAELALEEGREVMAVPGPVNSELSRGTNGLIQKGAKLVAGVDDVLEELPHGLVGGCRHSSGESESGRGSEAAEMGGAERMLMELLREGPRGLDQLSTATGLDAGELMGYLTSLALAGRIVEEAGGRYRLVPVLRGLST